MSYLLTHVIVVSRLRRIAAVATAISRRDLSRHCGIESADLVGEIVRAFVRMVEDLRSLIAQVGAMSEQIEADAHAILGLVAEVRARCCEQR